MGKFVGELEKITIRTIKNSNKFSHSGHVGGLLPIATQSTSGLMSETMAKRIFQSYYHLGQNINKVYKITPSNGYDVSKLYVFTDVGSLSEYIIHKNFVHEIISPLSNDYYEVKFFHNSADDVFVSIRTKSYGTCAAFQSIIPGYNGSSTSFSFIEVSIDISGLTPIEPKKV